MKHRRAFNTWTGEKDGLEHKPLKSMRIFAEDNPRRFFVEVYIWKHIWKHMWEMRALKRKDRKHTLGFWHSYDDVETKAKPDKLGRRVVSRKLGEMHLCIKACTYNTIAHEAYHATRTFARRSGNIESHTPEQAIKDVITRDLPEERNAYFHGFLTDRIIAGVFEVINARPRKPPKRRSEQI